MAMISVRPVQRCSGRTCPRQVAVRSDKASAVQQLQSSKAALNEKLAGVEDSMKAEARNGAAPSTSAATDLEDIEEINQDNYYDKIKNADAPVVVIDFYTEWCGPCKLMYPKLKAMKAELAGKATFYKFNCNKKNKDLGVSLGVKVAPTFFVYKDGEKASMLTGAKEDELRALIDEQL